MLWKGEGAFQACDFLGFCYNILYPKYLPERREVATKERKKYCIQTSSFLYSWCEESVSRLQLNIQEVQETLSPRPKEDPGLLPIFQNFFTFVKSRP